MSHRLMKFVLLFAMSNPVQAYALSHYQSASKAANASSGCASIRLPFLNFSDEAREKLVKLGPLGFDLDTIDPDNPSHANEVREFELRRDISSAIYLSLEVNFQVEVLCNMLTSDLRASKAQDKYFTSLKKIVAQIEKLANYRPSLDILKEVGVNDSEFDKIETGITMLKEAAL